MDRPAKRHSLWQHLPACFLTLQGSIIRIESRTTHGTGQIREETRYYISSLPPDAAQHLEFRRAHWAIENHCHWVLDVVFREDQSRVRCGDAAQNFSDLRRIALNLLITETAKPKEPINGLRQM